MPGIEIKPSDTSFVGANKVTMRSSSLLNGLVKDQARTLSVLKVSDPSISLNDIHISDDGAVNISHAGFASNLKTAISELQPANAMLDNGACGAGC